MMFSVRHLATAVAFSAVLGGCGSSTTSPAALVAPSASPSGTPVVVPSPTPTIAASPTPAPTLSPKELGTLCLKAATTYNKAVDEAGAAWRKSNQGLTADKREYAAFAKAELAFIRTVQAIPFTPKFTAIVARLVHDNNALYVYEQSASKARTLTEFVLWANRVERQASVAATDSNELRLALGLPPVPIT